MTAIPAPVRDWYFALTFREQALVGMAAVLAGLLMLIYGVVLPLGAAHDAAHARHREAVLAAGRVMAGLEQLQDAPAPIGQGGPVAQLAAQLAEAEGLVLQANDPRGNDGANVIVPTAAPGSALSFLDMLQRQGVIAEQVTITPAADGSVAVSAVLRRAGR